jgi:hypothetical protein
LRVNYPFIFVVPVNTGPVSSDSWFRCSWSNWLNPLKQVAQSLAIVRSRSQLCCNVATWNYKFPSKLLFTHFMERSASVANIKCGQL